MVSDNILSSFVGAEVTVVFLKGGHSSGLLKDIEKSKVILKNDENKLIAILRSKIKYIEHRAPWSKEFEKAVNDSVKKLIKSGKARTEKQAVEIMRKKFEKLMSPKRIF